MADKKQFQGFIYEELDNGEISITDCNKTDLEEVLIIPTSIDLKPVTRVSLNVFVDSGNYVKITKKAASKQARKEIILPETVSEILPYKSYFCCNVKKINIPENLPQDSVWKLNLPCICEFTTTESNTNYAVKEGVLFSKDFSELICCPNNLANKKYSIPEGTIRIGKGAFDNRYHRAVINRELSDRTIVIAKSVREIATEAFWDTHLKVEFTENNIMNIEKGVFMMGTFDRKAEVYFSKMEEYAGGAFSGNLLQQISFNKDCEIVYSQEIDFREYLLFSIKKMIAEEADLQKMVQFEFDTEWYDSKYVDHYFRVVICGLSEILEERIINLQNADTTVNEGKLEYSFSGNPQKSHFGKRTYKKYLDGFKKIIEIIIES